MARVRVGACGVLFWDEGNLVWDDYVRQRQLALTEDSQEVLRWFAQWRELDTADQLSPRHRAIADRLLQTGVLVLEHSPEDVAERRLLSEWQPWGPATRYHHFAARTLANSRYLEVWEDELHFAEKAVHDPAPQAAKSYPERPLTLLPKGRPDDAAWPRRDLLDVLYARRSTRQFTGDPVSQAALSAIVQIGGAPVEELDHPQVGKVLFKTSPSAGARTPLEMYVYVNRVQDLAPGLYHFAPLAGGLEDLGRTASADELLEAVGGQRWLADCAFLVIYTAVLARTRWRYQSRRAYRDILIELGHVSQTVLLTATAMGLGAVTATAVRDELLERLIGCDGVAEPVLGVTAVAVPRDPVTPR
ncbi:SagB/ThcOx family dehydrogenase [Nocardia sp. NPDC051321]|uniref:SagB/ThcOx family dehydrogenase n=1 Tax=Nocardia sp. NPDC051321 TaxID=3364323 RepID=UPI0037928F34